MVRAKYEQTQFVLLQLFGHVQAQCDLLHVAFSRENKYILSNGPAIGSSKPNRVGQAFTCLAGIVDCCSEFLAQSRKSRHRLQSESQCQSDI